MKKSFTIEIGDRAKIEIADAYDWYERQKTGLGEKFFKAFEKTLDSIKKWMEDNGLIPKTRSDAFYNDNTI